MPRKSTVALFASAAGLMAALACSVQTPLSPAPPGTTGGTAADGSTLKAGAPTPVSPINDATLTTTVGVTLTVSKPAVQFADANQPFTYEFELQNDSGAVLSRTTTAPNVTSATFTTTLTSGTAYRWRARALIGTASSPFSPLVRFQTPRQQTPTASSSDNDWRIWFEGLRDLRQVGPNLTVQALVTLDPDLVAAGVLQETNSARQPRGRLYLPTGSSNNLYGRTVDLGDFGGPWKWFSRGFSTCEGGSCK